jgi:hypothetical protein
MQTETDVQNLTRLAVQSAGGTAWRNNRGALLRPDGVPVRFGLANDSEQLGRRFKTGDLVGMTPGGLFLMLECKPPGWRYTGTEREVAQLAAIRYVRTRGGRAGFVTHPNEAVAVMLGMEFAGYAAVGAYCG